jgi:hypothetical protein
VIRIRGAITRGLRHPVFGPLLLLLIAIALVLIALHETTEDWLLPLLAACAAAAFVVVLIGLRPPWRLQSRGEACFRIPYPTFHPDPSAPQLVSLRL